MATTVTLEKCGRNHGYKGLDNSSFCPDSQCCIVGGPDCINSVIDMESVCKRVTASGLGVAVSVSKDAGRLLLLFTLFLNYKNQSFLASWSYASAHDGHDGDIKTHSHHFVKHTHEPYTIFIVCIMKCI